ncbi:MAG TPA: phosphate signaling complex protein PhoU [Anaeromyxobacteraceae bacterium]|jgi:phosphate transport system protein
MTAHPRRLHDRELAGLREQLLSLGSKVESQFAGSLQALAERDAEAARLVEAAASQVSRLAVEIDEACRRILAVRKRAARDLRFVAAALKMQMDLERMGNLTVGLARSAVGLAQAPPRSGVGDLVSLARLTQQQLRATLDALARTDAAMAQRVVDADGHLDAAYLRFFHRLLGAMIEDSGAIEQATGVLFAAKHLERFGEHCTSLAEIVIGLSRRADARHSHGQGAIRAGGEALASGRGR